MHFDLFTINSTIRALIETYIAFNHIYVFPKEEAEKEFKFSLWKIDGLFERQKYKIEKNDFGAVQAIQEHDEEKIKALITEIQCLTFYNKFQINELKKIFKPESKYANWRFKINDSSITPLRIMELVELTCPSRMFFNMYKYSSTHTHSGYMAVEQFEDVRGKIVSEEYVDSLVQVAIYLTIFLIGDICLLDKNAMNALMNFPIEDREEIVGINKASRNVHLLI